VRLVELGIEDFLLGRAINRVRHYYLELADGATKYFMLSGNDDAAGVMANMGLEPSGSQLYFTAAMAVGVVNAIVGGSVVAIAVGVAFDTSLALSVPVGGAVAVLIIIGAARYQRERRATGTRHPILFPSAEAS
jgi:hypothetical protein